MPHSSLSGLRRLIVLLTVATILNSCGGSKPSGSDYVGLWKGARSNNCDCLLDIARNGTSFVLKNESACHSCDQYESIFTLTPDGNLAGGPMGTLTISFDKQSKRAAFSPGGGLQYLTKLTTEQRERQIVLRRLMLKGFSFDPQPGPLCTIRGPSGSSCDVEPFVSAELSVDPAANTCAKLDKSTYLGQCSDGLLEGLCVVTADGSAKDARQAVLAYFSGGRILYPTITSFIDQDVLNFGVQEADASYGCVSFGKLDATTTNPGCARFKSIFGDDIFSESNALAMKNATFDPSRYFKVLKRLADEPSKE